MQNTTHYKIKPKLKGLDLSPGHTNNFKNGTYCSSACTGHNELEYGECLSHKKAQLIPYT